MAVNLSPIFSDAPYVDSNGDPFTGALLYTYTAGSSTPAVTYTTSAGSVQNSNPMTLNSAGYPTTSSVQTQVWLTAGVSYKFELKNSSGATIWTRDNITGINDTTVAQDQWVSGPAPTFVSTTSFTLVGDQTTAFHVGRRLKTTNSGGTIYSTISASAFGAVTTITVVNDSGVLDSGLSAVSYGLLSSTNPSTPLLTDAYPVVSGSADKTKKIRLEADGITTATTRVITMPDANVDLQYSRPASDTEVGAIEIAIQSEMETGSSTILAVTPGRQQFHPSAAKAWVKFNNAGTVAASHNITSITDNGTGDWTINIATDFSSANYCGVGFGGTLSTGLLSYALAVAAAAGSFQLICKNTANTATDPDTPNEIYAAFFGDQA